MENVQKITLDILNNRTYEQAYSKQYDKGRLLIVKLVEDGAPIDLTDTTVIFKAKKPDNTVIYNNCIIDTENSEVTIELTEQLTVLPGKIPFEIEITSKEKRLSRINIDTISKGDYSNSILNQLQKAIVSTNSSANPYRFYSDIRMINVNGTVSSGTLSPNLILKCSGANKIFVENEYVSSTVAFRDIVIYSSDSNITNFVCDIEYIAAVIVKTVSGTLKIEKAIVQDGDIESADEFSALQSALEELAVANIEAKDYYESMKSLLGIQSSKTAPTDNRISVWINTSSNSTIQLPEIKDEEISSTDTWSSQKISEILTNGSGTIDNEELNTALAEILV